MDLFSADFTSYAWNFTKVPFDLLLLLQSSRRELVSLIQDIAITINDWCASAEGQFDTERQQALLKGYQGIRKLTDQENELLPAFQQFAALRFTLTRLLSGGKDSPLKDPEEFLRITRQLPLPS